VFPEYNPSSDCDVPVNPNNISNRPIRSFAYVRGKKSSVLIKVLMDLTCLGERFILR
jgi:hypothetical protein